MQKLLFLQDKTTLSYTRSTNDEIKVLFHDFNNFTTNFLLFRICKNQLLFSFNYSSKSSIVPPVDKHWSNHPKYLQIICDTLGGWELEIVSPVAFKTHNLILFEVNATFFLRSFKNVSRVI